MSSGESIAQALDINPLSLLMPELMASNVAGIITLIGTPTNVLIGSYAGLSFSDFLINLTPGVILSLVGLIIYSQIAYRNDLKPLGGNVSDLLRDLKQRAQITEPGQLKKVGIVGAGMLILFVVGDRLQLVGRLARQAGFFEVEIWHYDCINRKSLIPLFEATDPLQPLAGWLTHFPIDYSNGEQGSQEVLKRRLPRWCDQVKIGCGTFLEKIAQAIGNKYRFIVQKTDRGRGIRDVI